MTAPRPSRTLYVVLATMLLLLPGLAVLQYQWIGEVSLADRQRMTDHLNQAGTQFAQDFDRELMRVVSPFQRRGSLEGSDVTYWLTQRYDDTVAAYPNLIHRIFIVRRTDAGLVLSKFDPESGQLQTTDWPAEFASLRLNLEARVERGGRQGPPQGWEPLSTPDPVFVVSIGPEGEPRGGFGRNNRQGPPQSPGWTMLELNRKTLFEEFIPSIVSRHFTPSNNAEYRIAIVSRGASPQTIYKSAAAFTDAEMKQPDFRIPLL